MLIPDWLHRQAQQFPDHTALEDLHSGRTFSYLELDRRASRCAHFFRDRWRLRPGDRVALLAHNSAEYVEILYGCAKAGLILVGLNWRLSLDELKAIVDDAKPAALVYGLEFTAGGEALVAAFGLERGLALADGYEAALAEASGERIRMGWRGHDDPWYLLYTAGTTGKAKGVVQTFGMCFTNCVNILLHAGIRRDDVLLAVLPFFHTGGLNLYMNPMLMTGGTTVIMRQFDVDRTLELLGSRITVMFGVPAIYLFLSQHPKFAATDFSRVRSWGAGGAPMPRAVLDAYFAKGVTICFGFGMTESSPTVFLTDEDTARKKIGTVGLPVMYMEAKVVDPATRATLGTGQRGEMLLRGPGITPGYWNNPEATATSFEDGWLCTGDVAYVDEDGCFYIVDRTKDMYISGGENVYPAEVENVLYQLECVAETAVIGVPDDRWGEVGKAILALKPGAELTAEAAIAHCRAHLAAFKAPRHVVFVPALPRNALGKVDKAGLRREFGGQA
ncbi:acyl-CoA synthetase [Mesoterricola silvestris]|uniref:Acid--CoA ligase n=1 Tax=Mesoterricola silvestris TaxID=2927979 RepID=A0AA48GQ69_9BACT|nr:long-chain fatty acid--CoA ligase [Mesoterricola silvestris]BDU73690.1 acid--CoA ligase [Mesoterricola silvestris]